MVATAIGQNNTREMNKYNVVILSLISVFMMSCGSSKDVVSQEVEETINESVENSISDLEDEMSIVSEDVTAEEFKALIDKNNGILLDVRTKDEVASGMIKNAINLDYYSATFKDDVAKLDKNKPVYVYCRSGGRSGGAKKILTSIGFKTVYNLKGGYSNWPYK